MKTVHIGIIFGGQSPEHSISIISALNIINGLDKNQFEISIFAISKNNKWINQSASQKIVNGLKNSTINDFSYVISPKKDSDIMKHAEIKKQLNNLDLVFGFDIYIHWPCSFLY